MYPCNDEYTSVLSQAEITIRIEQFVTDVLATEKLAYEPNPATPPSFRPLPLSIYLPYLGQMLDLFNGQVSYDYSEHICCLRDACHDIGLQYAGGRYVCPDPSENVGYLRGPETFNLLVERIRVLGGERIYKHKQAQRRYEAKHQKEKVEQLVWGFTERYARTMVVRVNLYYRTAARQRLRVEHVFDDLERLSRARLTDGLFDALSGYILRVEQGEDQGFHIHAAFFFDGSRVFRQFCMAERIGELWVDITQSRGYWHDSGREWRNSVQNMEVDDDHNGTGMFLRSDIKGRQAVVRLMTYLVKDKGQHLRIKPLRARAYRTGLICE
tara:strand:+ start:2938 stop:3915 length:978 start_codon:yes stop_codon:yes gene_type:complete